MPAGSRGIPAPCLRLIRSDGRQDAARTGRLEACPTLITYEQFPKMNVAKGLLMNTVKTGAARLPAPGVASFADTPKDHLQTRPQPK